MSALTDRGYAAIESIGTWISNRLPQNIRLEAPNTAREGESTAGVTASPSLGDRMNNLESASGVDLDDNGGVGTDGGGGVSGDAGGERGGGEKPCFSTEGNKSSSVDGGAQFARQRQRSLSVSDTEPGSSKRTAFSQGRSRSSISSSSCSRWTKLDQSSTKSGSGRLGAEDIEKSVQKREVGQRRTSLRIGEELVAQSHTDRRRSLSFIDTTRLRTSFISGGALSRTKTRR